MRPTDKEPQKMFPVAWADYWLAHGNTAMAHNFEAFNAAFLWARANADALRTATQPTPDGYVLVRRELNLRIANALGYDTAFSTWEEMCDTWDNVIAASEASGGEGV